MITSVPTEVCAEVSRVSVNSASERIFWGVHWSGGYPCVGASIHTLQVLVELDEELGKDEEAILVLVVGDSVVDGRPLLTAVLSLSEVAISC